MVAAFLEIINPPKRGMITPATTSHGGVKKRHDWVGFITDALRRRAHLDPCFFAAFRSGA